MYTHLFASYLCVYMYTFICLFLFVCIYVYIYLPLICVYICIHLFASSYLCVYMYTFICLFLFVCIYVYIYWHLLVYIYIYICLFLFIYIQILAFSYLYMLAKRSTCHWITVVRYYILCSSCKSKLALMHCILGKRCCHVMVFISSRSVHHVMLNHRRCVCSGVMRCSRHLRSASSQCWI